MNKSIRSQILIFLYEKNISGSELFEQFELPIGIYFNLLKSLKNQELIDYNETILPKKFKSQYIYPDISINIKLTELGKKYTKRSFIDCSKKEDFTHDNLDFFQFNNGSIHIPSFEKMSYTEFSDKYPNSSRDLKIENEILFYILTGVKIEKEIIINEPIFKNTLKWLEPYNTSYQKFREVLIRFDNKQLDRNLLDDLRFSFEQFLRDFFQNMLPIEKQGKVVKKYLSENGISSEISNMYNDVFSRFYQYQNENVKHNEKFSPIEINFFIEITRSLMQLLLETKTLKEAH